MTPAGEADKHPRTREVARAVANGTPVDWDDAESSAPTDADRDLIRQLRVIAAVASLGDGSAWPSAAVHGTGPGHGPDTTGAGPAPQPAASPPHALITWGSLVLQEKIGAGSFGEVYRAWDPRLDREVALKLLRSPRSPSSDALDAAVLAEGRALARVRHPNVVTIHGSDRVDGQVGLWMEYIHGRTLKEILDEHGPFSAQEAALAGVAVCRAAAAIHRQGLVHGDIKAQNVMREEGGRTVLMDFGSVSGVLSFSEGATLTGTPLYLAPERFEGGPATVASDVFAIGTLLFHLATGTFPVQARTLSEVRDAHRAGRRLLLGDLRPDLPRRFIDVVERACAEAPADRFGSAGALERALTAPLTDESVAEPATSRPAAVPEETRIRAWHLAITAAALAVALFTAAWWTPPLRARVEAAFGRSGNRAAATPPAAVSDGPVARKLPIPDWSMVGRPSADGSILPYADLEGDLAVFDVTAGTSRTLTHVAGSSEQATLSVPSPDGTLIAYGWHALDGAQELRVIRADGTRPHVILREPGSREIGPLDWAPDAAQVLAFVEGADGRHRLLLVDATGSSKSRVVRDLGFSRPLLASVSPDGRHVAFDARAPAPGGSRDVFVAALEGMDEPTAIAATTATEAYPTWSADGESVLYVSGELGPPSLWVQRVVEGRAEGRSRFVARDLGRIMGLGLSANGRYFYVRQAGFVDVFVGDPRKPSSVSRASLDGAAGQNLAPAWSPDGASLAWVEIAGFIRADRQARRLAVRDTNSDTVSSLATDLAFFISPTWSPDGGSLLVTGIDGRNRMGFHRVDLRTGRSRPALLAPEGREDLLLAGQELAGGAIAYATEDRIVRRDIDKGLENTLVDVRDEDLATLHPPSFGGRVFEVSPDGGAIAFSGYRGEPPGVEHEVRIREFGGNSRTVVQSQQPNRVVFQAWTPDGRGIYFTRNQAGKQDVALYVASSAGGDSQPTGIAQSHLRDVAVDRRRGRIAFTAGTEHYEVWTLNNVVPGNAAAGSVRR